MIQEAINNVLNGYNQDCNSSLQNYEYGYLFWKNCTTNRLRPGKRIVSQDTNSVKLYPDSARQKILLQKVKIKEKLYVGEFHAHPIGNGTWAGQLPSPDDIVNAGVSVAGNLWPLQPPINGVNAINISPEFQIIQSLIFGDLIVLERGSERMPFDCLDEQNEVLEEIRSRYSQWHQCSDLQESVDRLDHESFYEAWSEKVREIGDIIGSRISVTSVKNEVDPTRS